MSSRLMTTCPRCGLVRQIHSGNGTPLGQLCRDCRYVEPRWPDIDNKPKRAA